MVKERKSHLSQPYCTNKDLCKAILKYNTNFNGTIYLFFYDEYNFSFVWNTCKYIGIDILTCRWMHVFWWSFNMIWKLPKDTYSKATKHILEPSLTDQEATCPYFKCDLSLEEIYRSISYTYINTGANPKTNIEAI